MIVAFENNVVCSDEKVRDYLLAHHADLKEDQDALGGDDGDFQILGKAPDGWQRVPRRQSAGEDLGLDLPADLIVDRLATVVSDNEFHGSPPFVLYIHSIYSWREMSRGIFKIFRGRFRGSVVY